LLGTLDRPEDDLQSVIVLEPLDDWLAGRSGGCLCLG
jgi:hypothetical protein